MTVPFGFTVTLVIQGAATGTDVLGNDTFTPAELAVPGCMFAPGASTEATGRQDQVIDQPIVYAPTGTPVAAYDTAIVPGYGTYPVDGLPAAWPAHPRTGWSPSNSVVIRLRRVTG